MPRHTRRILSLLVLLAGLGACARPAELRLDPGEWDFGSIPSYHVAERQLQIQNPGTKPVKLRFISTCDCLQVHEAPTALAAGATVAVRLSYDPSGQSGFVEAALIVVAGLGGTESRRALRAHGKVLPAGGGGAP